jgi:hypothetical protein
MTNRRTPLNKKQSLISLSQIAIATTRSIRPYIFSPENHGKNFSFRRRE